MTNRFYSHNLKTSSRERLTLDFSDLPSTPQRGRTASARVSTAKSAPFSAPHTSRSLKTQSTGTTLFNQSQSNYPTADNLLLEPSTLVSGKLKPKLSDLEEKLKTLERNVSGENQLLDSVISSLGLLGKTCINLFAKKYKRI
jgi:hypothetical protein